MKLLIGFVLCIFSGLCTAQEEQPKFDGNWIKKAIDACDRVYIKRNASPDDITESIAFVAFVSGMLAVHHRNNLTASILVNSLTEKKKALRNSAASAEIDKQLRVALAFTPLLAVPDRLSQQQIVAVVRKYLDANPQEWSTNASLLITKAFQEAFAVKSLNAAP